jgi:hypothetical protein
MSGKHPKTRRPGILGSLTAHSALTLVASIAALCISLQTCRVSDRANSIASGARSEAEKANEIAWRAFSVASRPQLILTPIKPSQTGKYVDQELVDGRLVFAVAYELKNVGEGIASTVTISYTLELAPWVRAQPSSQVRRQAPLIDLAPGETRPVRAETEMGLPAEELIAWMRDTPDWRLVTGVTVTYSWHSNPGALYTTNSVYSFGESSWEMRANEYREERPGPERIP